MNIHNKSQIRKSKTLSRLPQVARIKFLSLVTETPNSRGGGGLSFSHVFQLITMLIIPNDNTKIWRCLSSTQNK